MSYQLIFFDARAKKKFLDSFDWHEDQQEGLGNGFKKAVYEKLNEIQQYPERYHKKENHTENQEPKNFLS